MISRWLPLLVFIVIADSQASDFEPTASIGNHQLQLCSQAPIKVLSVISVGKAALYLADCDKTEQMLQQPIQLAIIYQRAFSAEDFIESATKLLKRNIPQDQFNDLREELDTFNSNYQAIAKGERYDICHSPQTGLLLHKNGRQIARSESSKLAQAYFKIWFGERPFNKKLKKQLLDS